MAICYQVFWCEVSTWDYFCFYSHTGNTFIDNVHFRKTAARYTQALYKTPLASHLRLASRFEGMCYSSPEAALRERFSAICLSCASPRIFAADCRFAVEIVL